MIPDHEGDRKKRMLAILMGNKTKDLMTPDGEADTENEEHGGISLEGKPGDAEVTCPKCGTHIDTNLDAKDGGEGSSEEEMSESPDVEKEEQKGRLFGHPKKGIGLMIGMK